MIVPDNYKRPETPDFISVFHSRKNQVSREFALGALQAMIRQVTEKFADA